MSGDARKALAVILVGGFGMFLWAGIVLTARERAIQALPGPGLVRAEGIPKRVDLKVLRAFCGCVIMAQGNRGASEDELADVCIQSLMASAGILAGEARDRLNALRDQFGGNWGSVRAGCIDQGWVLDSRKSASR